MLLIHPLRNVSGKLYMFQWLGLFTSNQRTNLHKWCGFEPCYPLLRLPD